MIRVRLFGLTIESEIPLPGLIEAAATCEIDVTIRCGPLGPEADLIVAEAGSFTVRDGREIIVDPVPGVPERNVRLYLMGSAMGLLLHQRGIFPLHANAVALDGCVVAVAGASGAGKSTLAAWFTQQGLTLIGDDVLALKETTEGMMAFPGPPRVRLWREALDSFGVGSEGLEQSYVDPDYDKWDLPVATPDLATAAFPVGAIYVLADAPRIGIERLGGAAAVAALFDHTYRGEYLERVGGAIRHWQAVTALASAVPIFQLARPRDLSQLDALGQAVLRHARDQVARTSGDDR